MKLRDSNPAGSSADVNPVPADGPERETWWRNKKGRFTLNLPFCANISQLIF